MRSQVIWGAGIGVSVLLALIMLPGKAKHVQDTLQVSVERNLAAAGYGRLNPVVDGQTVLISRSGLSTQDQATITRTLLRTDGPGGFWSGPVMAIEFTDDLTPNAQPEMPRLAVAHSAAPTDPIAQCQADLVAAQKDREIAFRFGGFRLAPETDPVLDDLYSALGRCPLRVVVVVSGHTDDRGDAETNRLISAERARVVAQSLVDRGWPFARIRSEGKGEAEPIADNKDALGRSKNRRVVLTLVAADSGGGT
ncbi:MAG: OmpA family protein [Asticcacaulis sp.]